jgi:hypothetical protein
MRNHINLVIDTAANLPSTGLWLRNNAQPVDTIAVIDAGAIPYYSNLSTIDMIGLNDYHIATLPGPWLSKYDNEYVLAKEPDYIQMHLASSIGGKALLPTDFLGTLLLYHSPDFQRWYELIPEVPGTHIFRRRELPLDTTHMDRYESVRYDITNEVIKTTRSKPVSVQMQVTNEGTAVWPAGGGVGWGIVRIFYRLFPAQNHDQILHEQYITLPQDLSPGETIGLTLQINAPDTPGDYTIEIDMVAEMIFWFSEKGAPKPTLSLTVD